MIRIKSPEQQQRMRLSGRIASGVLSELARQTQPGISTYELDEIAGKLLADAGAKSACKGYRLHGTAYPSNICISVNNEVVHGIGSLKRVVQEGDIVSLDVVSIAHGMIADNALTLCVGDCSMERRRLVETSLAALHAGVAMAQVGRRVGEVSSTVQRFVESAGYSVVRDLVGHGVGIEMHEEPQVPNFGRPSSGPLMKAGMTLAIEPMVNAGGYAVRTLRDGWTVVTTDGSDSAHFEYTVLITEAGPEVLTPWVLPTTITH